MGPDQLNVDLPTFAAAQAQLIGTMPEKFQEMAISNLEAQSPELADLVRQIIASQKKPGSPGSPQMDTRPLPAQRSPRRATPSV